MLKATCVPYPDIYINFVLHEDCGLKGNFDAIISSIFLSFIFYHHCNRLVFAWPPLLSTNWMQNKHNVLRPIARTQVDDCTKFLISWCKYFVIFDLAHPVRSFLEDFVTARVLNEPSQFLFMGTLCICVRPISSGQKRRFEVFDK